MTPHIERVYLREVLTECSLATRAVQRLNAILNASDIEPGPLFIALEEFLSHAAAVSRLLWPAGGRNAKSRDRAEARGIYLRSVLQLEGDHALKDRTLRDHLTHYDERLDEWAASSELKRIIDHLIGDRSAVGGHFADTDIMRHYDPGSKQFVFRGEAFNIQTISTGIDDVFNRALPRIKQLKV